jgi:ketosteroid isomerase-like protein
VEYIDLDAANEIQDGLSSFLEGWRGALAEGTYHQYLSYFDAGYLPPIQWWNDWQTLRDPAKNNRQPLQVEVVDLAIYRHRELLVATFAQVISVDDKRMQAGIRKLFVTETEVGYRIVGDVYVPENGPRQLSEEDNPLLTAARKYRTTTEPEQMIRSFLDAWLSAWSAKDMKAYGECYAADFRSQGKDRNQWLAYKKELNRRYEYIAVSATDISQRRNGNEAIVRFRQLYESNTFKAKGVKTLHLRMEAGRWKITRETYSGN